MHYESASELMLRSEHAASHVERETRETREALWANGRVFLAVLSCEVLCKAPEVVSVVEAKRKCATRDLVVRQILSCIVFAALDL